MPVLREEVAAVLEPSLPASAWGDGTDSEPTGGWWRATGRVFAQNRLGLFGLGVILFIVLFCFVGPLLYTTNQVSTTLSQVDLSPSLHHLLGTDDSGYDVLGRLMLGGQSTLEVGAGSAFIANVLGLIWGVIPGFLGGWVDAVLMRVVDAVLAIPPLVLLLVTATLVVPSVPIVIIVIALISWVYTARLVRGECLALREREYVEAAQAMGASQIWVIVRHGLPNLVDVVVVQTSLQMANAVLLLAALSFLGLGPPPPATNWGNMLASGLTYIYDGYWWLLYPAGVAIVLTVVGFNLVGDAVRDAFDVRLQSK